MGELAAFVRTGRRTAVERCEAGAARCDRAVAEMGADGCGDTMLAAQARLGAALYRFGLAIVGGSRG